VAESEEEVAWEVHELIELLGLEAFLTLALAGDLEALEQGVLLAGSLLVADLPLVVVDLELEHLAADLVLVVELAVSLVGDLLRDPRRPPHRSERKRGEPGEETHG
jgi:hypothetical protein